MVLTLLVAAPAAQAGTRADIVADCFDDGKLDGNYTASQIRDARNNLPADVDQYSDCRDVLARALGGSGSSNVGGGGAAAAAAAGEPLAPSGPDEQRALEAAVGDGGAKPVQVGDSTVVPGASGFAAGAARSAIPTSLLVALILLGVAALAAAAPYPRRTVSASSSDVSALAGPPDAPAARPSRRSRTGRGRAAARRHRRARGRGRRACWREPRSSPTAGCGWSGPPTSRSR